MNMFKKKPRQKMIFQCVKPIFKTADGVEHSGFTYNYVNKSRTNLSVGEYLMIDINDDGYIQDRNTMYPLSNVLSIEWHILDEIQCVYDEAKCWRHGMFWTPEEIEKLEKWDGKCE